MAGKLKKLKALILGDIYERRMFNGRDSDDDKFIACAVSASADFIVSGDKDLLDVGKYKSVKIISASEFLKMF